MHRLRFVTFSLVGVAMLVGGRAASAAILTADPADQHMVAWGLESVAAAVAEAGSQDYSAARSYVIPFQLPNLGALADPFSSATFHFTVLGYAQNGTDNVRARLFGIDARSSATVGLSDNGAGALLQHDLPPQVDAVADYSADVTSFLNAQYNAGAGAGQFVFLRFGPSDTGQSRWYFATADNSVAEDRPYIDYSVIPEPGSMALLALGAALALPRRRG